MTDIERLCNAVMPAWQSAHASPSKYDWEFRWGAVAHRLDGIAAALIHMGDLEQYKALSDDIDLLNRVAMTHWLNIKGNK